MCVKSYNVLFQIQFFTRGLILRQFHEKCSFKSSEDVPGDVFFDVRCWDGCHGHGHWLRSTQPVRVVGPTGVVAHVVQVAEHVGHGRETTQAAARGACFIF